MCGIAAIYAYRHGAPPVPRPELLKIRDSMISRGPDGFGEWCATDGSVALAHRRLSIIDLSDAASQPMATGDGRLRIVFNGEIYNYQALRQGLEAKGYHFLSNSDTEVLLHLYAESGREMVHQLRGMYAFALWDEANRGLLLARDPFGIKPLYYADNGATIRVASQVKALLAGGAVDTSRDPAGQVGFFLWGHVPEPYTTYRGIRAVPAGATMWVDEKGARPPSLVCSISRILADAGERSTFEPNNDEREETLRQAVFDSVQHHLVADVPVGVFLSSGLDSITLTAAASKICHEQVRTVTLGFREYRGTEFDEVPLAEEIANRCATDHCTVTIDRDDFRDELPDFLRCMDQPTIDGANVYFVSKATARAGLKVALTGLGGDEIFGGYPSFGQIPALVRALRPGRHLPWLGKAFRWVSAPWIKYLTSPKYAGILEYGTAVSGAYLLRRGLFMPWELPDLLDGDVVREGWRELQPLLRLEETVSGIADERLAVAAAEMCWYMRNQLLRDADWAGMAHSVEIRTPYVDVEFMRTVAPLFVGDSTPTKADVARLVTAGAIPVKILGRPKTGFSIPVREWMYEGRAGKERGLRGWAKVVIRANGRH
jgi:asparagine synthase (glutamine-hydrolysing)